SVSGFGNNQNELDYTNAQINSSEWLKQNPDFNIRTDLNDALIDEQRIYQNKLIEQNKELSSTTDGKDYAIDPATGKSNAYGLIPTIYQLDYCIPGPHPGWEADSGNELDKELSKVLDTDGMDFLQVGQATGMSTNLGAGIMIVSKLLGVADTDTIDEWSKILGTGHAHCGSSPPVSISECVSRDYYVKELLRFTHIPALSVDSDYLQSYSKFTNIIDRIYTEYKAGIKNTYISEVLPSAAKESETEFAKVPGYDQIINANRKTIDTLNGTITRLKEIKFKIDEANAKLKSGTMSVDDYETGPDGITPWKNAFVRVSYSLYSGDDIATVDDDTKLFIDEKNYVLNSLIGGHTGCEEELASPNSQLPKQLSGGSVLGRPDYPLPILYKYPGPSEKGFLYWGHYMDWQGHFPDGYAIGQAVDLCKAYVKYNKSTDEGCSSIVGIPDYNHIKGPNYIHISDLLEIQDGGTTGTIGYSPLNLPKAGDFERDILKMW
ncbi:MAG: hypothetical protein WCQ47_08855, partial [bacterium]